MDRLAGFSNFGYQTVDVAAPGVRIYSLGISRRTLWQENFNTGLMPGWATGGTMDSWAVRPLPLESGSAALSMTLTDTYPDDADAWAQLPVQDLSQGNASRLHLEIIGAMESENDRLFLEISTDENQWLNLPFKLGAGFPGNSVSGIIPFWTGLEADLGAWDGKPEVFVRLHFQSDSGISDTGYYIDNLQITASESDEAYQLMSGTSMAAAFVTGLSALVQSRNPGAGVGDIRSIIERSVDLDRQFEYALATGGRVNAFNALTLMDDLSLSASTTPSGDIHLSWTSQSLLSGPVTIERCSELEDEFESIGNAAAGSNEYFDRAADPETPYYYRLQIRAEEGRMGYSNQAQGVPMVYAAQQDDASDSGGCFLSSMKP